MAENNGTTRLQTWTVTQRDMEGLADHLAARSVSRLIAQEPAAKAFIGFIVAEDHGC